MGQVNQDEIRAQAETFLAGVLADDEKKGIAAAVAIFGQLVIDLHRIANALEALAIQQTGQAAVLGK